MKPYYDDGSVTIYHADCREVVPSLPAPSLVLTDPPYGIADIWQGGMSHGWAQARAKGGARNTWDAEAPDLGHVLALDCQKIIWGGNYFPLPPSRGWLVWRKEVNPALTLGDAELAWTSAARPVRVFDHPRSKLTGAKVPEHPTAKPLSLMVWCLGLFPGSGLVLDPYMGSGTTLRAAKEVGRRVVGIEINERYCEIAANRLRQEVLPLEVIA